MNDDGRRIALFMRFLGFDLHRARMVEPSDFRRLLPVCCPNFGPAAFHRSSELENASLSRFCEFSWIAVLLRMRRDSGHRPGSTCSS